MVPDMSAARRPSPTGLRRFLDLEQQHDWMEGKTVPRDADERSQSLELRLKYVSRFEKLLRRPQVQMDRKTKTIRDAAGVREKFGVEPALIPDFLALVGDAADGYPGLEGIGRVSATRLLSRFGPIESFPREVLGERHKLALLFKTLATLRTDERLFANVEELRWRGPTQAFAAFATQLSDPRLLARSLKAGKS
jgi:5'-3' exonuclease